MKQVILVMYAIFAVHAYATIINVPGNQPTIQAGINVAAVGDTVLVDTGTYYEIIDFNGKSIVVASHFILTQDTLKILNTIISSSMSGTVVSIIMGEDSTTLLEGFTIRDGYAANGSGIYCDSLSRPTIRNNIITNNLTFADGAGIFVVGQSAPTIVWNVIKYNNAEGWGGGIYVFDGSSPFISRNVIFCNGMLESLSQSVDIDRGNLDDGNIIVVAGRCLSQNDFGFSRASNGGGILITNYTSQPTSPVIINNTIDENLVSDDGGGIFCNLATPDIRNNIITNNDGYGIFVQGQTVEVTYNDVWGNILSNYGGLVTVGIGSISTDPLFVNPTSRDYHLQPGSPCINAGDPASPLDPDSTRTDMGVFYYDQTSVLESEAKSIGDVGLGQTILSGPLLLPEGKSCRVFDITGRIVIPDKIKPGIYFIEVDGVISHKIIKVK